MVFVITGGGSGIGRALAQRLAIRDKHVLIVGRRDDALLQTAAASPLISICRADLTTAAGRECLLDHVRDCKQIDGLIHNAGTIDPVMPLARMDENAWRHALELNVNAPLFLSQALLDKLSQGRVLHIGTAVAYFPVEGWGAYCSSKAALAMLTRCWQLENPLFSFSSVQPGIVDTDMQALIRVAPQLTEDKRNFFKTLQETNRLVAPDTVALFLSWLLLDVDREAYVSKEWDIYDTSHHAHWLQAPHTVPPLD